MHAAAAAAAATAVALAGASAAPLGRRRNLHLARVRLHLVLVARLEGHALRLPLLPLLHLDALLEPALLVRLLARSHRAQRPARRVLLRVTFGASARPRLTEAVASEGSLHRGGRAQRGGERQGRRSERRALRAPAPAARELLQQPRRHLLLGGSGAVLADAVDALLVVPDPAVEQQLHRLWCVVVRGGAWCVVVRGAWWCVLPRLAEVAPRAGHVVVQLEVVHARLVVQHLGQGKHSSCSQDECSHSKCSPVERYLLGALHHVEVVSCEAQCGVDELEGHAAGDVPPAAVASEPLEEEGVGAAGQGEA
eukprot:scaffold13646_cov52-Phaeocystis_antarctica.AAC.2